MENTSSTLRIAKEEFADYNHSLKSSKVLVNEKHGKLKSRLGIVYFVVLVSSLVVLFLR